jgi:hypothetical protein
MTTKKADYRTHTSKVSVITPEAKTFIDFERMLKQVAKATSEIEMEKISVKHRKYLDTKIITYDMVVNLMMHGCELIIDTFEHIPIQLIEGNTAIENMIIMVDALDDGIFFTELEEQTIGCFSYLVRNYIEVCEELGISVCNELGDIAGLLSIYLLIAYEYINLNKAA